MEEIFKRLADFCNCEVDDLEFAIIFGSRALGCDQSDIDFKIFSKSTASISLRNKVANFAASLNSSFFQDAKIGETDVPYAIKTIIDKQTLEDAINLKAFLDIDGKISIPRINFNKHFLESRECQMRTILSALTTPHIFISGNKDSYQSYVKKAFDSVKRLISTAYKISVDDREKMIDLFLYSEIGETYKEYLGYKDSPAIRKHLLENI